MSNLKAPEYQKFEDVKHINEDGIEFWYGRELAPVLDYLRWENFSKAIDRAMLACQNSGFPLDDHFREVTKMVELGSGSQRSIKDYVLLLLQAKIGKQGMTEEVGNERGMMLQFPHE